MQRHLLAVAGTPPPPGGEHGVARKGGDMNKHTLHRVVPLAAAVVLAFAPAVARADTGPIAAVEKVGETAVLYRGPQVDVAISYRPAARNPGMNWLMLDAALTSNYGPIEIPRTAISLRTPDGRVVPLASHEAYAKGYSELAPAILQDNAIPEPLGYLTPLRFRRLTYFPAGGVGISWASAWVDEWHNSYGRLFFQLPDGVQRGTYKLLIDLPESHVVIPFTL